MYENRRIANEDIVFDIGSTDDIPFDDDYFEASNHFSSFMNYICTFFYCFCILTLTLTLNS